MDDEFEEGKDGENNENEQSERAESDKEEKSISSDLIRGHINTIILRSLSDSDKYGYEIISEIEKKSCGQYSIKQPSLYSALKRLETQGFITSYWGGTAGGGRRKYFSLTEDGRAIAEQNRSEWEYSRTIIDSLISDKDFDFSNPAPSAVNMRVLKDTTSRVPSRETEECGTDTKAENTEEFKELENRYQELLAEKDRIQEELSESRAREEYLRSERYESENLSSELNEDERTRYQNIIRGRDEIINNLDARYEELLQKEKKETEERERERYEELLKSEREQFQKAQEILSQSYRQQYEELILKSEEGLSEEERAKYEKQIREREEELEKVQKTFAEQTEASMNDEERERYESLLRKEKEKLEEETARYKAELEEQAALFREREKEIRHQNYINLINTPPATENAAEDFDHYTPPLAPEPVPEESAEANAEEPGQRDYRAVVEELYSSSIRTEAPAEISSDDAHPLDRIDFRDIETKAAQDGIKIITSGKTDRNVPVNSPSLVHKGKALFLSALLLFFVIVIEGAIVLGVKGTYGISVAYPCVMWGIGLIVLLVTGLAYANHYGERSLRKPTPALINSIVLYVLAVILTLIVALSVNIDFHSAKDLAAYIVIPVIYLFGIVIFGIAYYFQIKSKK